jgi:hypothetical protein
MSPELQMRDIVSRSLNMKPGHYRFYLSLCHYLVHYSYLRLPPPPTMAGHNHSMPCKTLAASYCTCSAHNQTLLHCSIF